MSDFITSVWGQLPHWMVLGIVMIVLLEAGCPYRGRIHQTWQFLAKKSVLRRGAKAGAVVEGVEDGGISNGNTGDEGSGEGMSIMDELGRSSSANDEE